MTGMTQLPLAATRRNPALSRFHSVQVLAVVGGLLLLALITFNATSSWIGKNGGLASWLQAIGSLYAIVAVSVPVWLQRRITVDGARDSVLTSARLATDLMSTVGVRAFDPDARFSEWYVPQWDVIGEIIASAPIHDIQSPRALEAFVTIREVYNRMRSWDEQCEEAWPRTDGVMMGFVGSLCSNASAQMKILEAELGRR